MVWIFRDAKHFKNKLNMKKQCRRSRSLCRVIISLLTALIATAMAMVIVTRLSQFDDQQKLSATTIQSPIISSSNPKVKTILYWNSWDATMGDQPLIKAHCPVTACLFTPDLTLFNQSDIILFSIETTPDFLVNRLPHQRFVFFVMESPTNTYQLPVLQNSSTRYNYFNWTMSYRRDSDIVLRDFLGAVASKNDPGHQYPPRPSNQRQPDFNRTMKLSSVDTLERLVMNRNEKKMDYAPAQEPIASRWLQKKSKLVAWFVSHCETPIQREEYVRQLGQHIPVDIYGRCGTKQQVTSICDSAEDPYNCDEIETLRAEYKFYLAFENSWCPDYVTEKFYRTLQFDTVPVVLGGVDYQRFAPPHSYINALDFSTPKQLAEYLLLLNNSQEHYAQYFRWRNDYDVLLPAMDGWCDLCRMAHDETLPTKVYPDIKQWWVHDGECENDRNKYF